MRVELTGRHVTISPGLRRLVDRKLGKVQRVLNDSGLSATVVITKERIHSVVELTLHARGEHFLHAVGKADSWEMAMTEVIDKVLHQAEKMKGKWHERQRRGPASRSAHTPRAARRASARTAAPVTSGLPDAPRRRVIRASRYSVKPMTVEEAALELDGQKTAFLVFRDATTDAVNVLYRRADGQFALIEPDA